MSGFFFPPWLIPGGDDAIKLGQIDAYERGDEFDDEFEPQGLTCGPLEDFFTPDEAIAIARAALDEPDAREDEERFEPEGLTAGPLDEPLAAAETGAAEFSSFVEIADEAEEAWSPVWAQAPPDQDDQLVRAALDAPVDEEDEPPPEDLLGRPLAFPGDETGETTGGRVLDEPGDDEDDVAAGLTAGPLDSDDEPSASASQVSREEEDDDVDGGVGAGPLDDAPAAADASIFAASLDAAERGEDDEPPGDLVAGPLEDAAAADASIVAAALDAPAEVDESEPAGVIASPPDQDDQPPLAAMLWQAPGDDGEAQGEDLLGRPLGSLGDETGETTGGRVLDEPGDEDDDVAGGVTQGPPDQDDQRIAAIAIDVLEDDDEDPPAGLTAGPPAEDDDLVRTAALIDAPGDELEDDAPAGLVAGPLDEPAADASIIAAQLGEGYVADLADDVDGGLVAGPRADAVSGPAIGLDVAYETIKAWLIATWTATPLRFENETLDRPAGLGPFVFLEVWRFLGLDESEIGSGDPATNVWRDEGEAVFHVLVASGTGARDARGLAEDLAGMLKGLVLTNGVRLGALSIGGGEELTGDGNVWDLPVTAQWARDNWKLGSN